MSDGIIAMPREGETAVPISAIVKSSWLRSTTDPANFDFINLELRDAPGVAALDQAIKRAEKALDADPGFHDLLKRQHWENPQREKYEAYLAEAVAASFTEDPLIGKYRHDPNRTAPANLTTLTPQQELDCDGMSAMRGIAWDRLEKKYLRANDPDTWKRPHEYYVISGTSFTLNNGSHATKVGSHATIMSSATGNILDSTAPSDAYFKSDYPYSFRDYVVGLPFVGHRVPNSDPTKVLKYEPVIISSGTPNPDVLKKRQQAFDENDFHALGKAQFRNEQTDEDMVTNLHYGEALLKVRTQAQMALNTVPQTLPLASAAPYGQPVAEGRNSR